jgi:hypothetical protein
MNYRGTAAASFAVDGMQVTDAKVFEISPENPRQEISPLNPKVFDPVEKRIEAGEQMTYQFPARSVCVVELDCRAA